MRAANAPDLEIVIIVQSLAENNMTLVIGQDRGSGLDKIMKERISEPFFSTKPCGIDEACIRLFDNALLNHGVSFLTELIITRKKRRPRYSISLKKSSLVKRVRFILITSNR
jgi:hypothetical protein